MARKRNNLLALCDDLLAEILVLLPTLADHGRACVACATFHRVITSDSFLRRLHALHRPSLFGFLSYTGKFQPVEPPHPSAAVGRALAGAVDFRFLFLPKAGFWEVRDARGGLFVLDRTEDPEEQTFTKIAVCDPLKRRSVDLPPIPDDLVDSIHETGTLQPPLCLRTFYRRCDMFLVPGGEEEEEAVAVGQPRPFRLIWTASCPTRPIALVFSSATMQWRAIACPGWNDLNPVGGKTRRVWCRLSYVHGCFYWNAWDDFNLAVLDTSRMEFVSVNLPPGSGLDSREVELAVVELTGSRRGIFILDRRSNHLQLFSASRQDNGEGATEWVLENQVSLLPSFCDYSILGDADGKLILQKVSGRQEAVCCVSVDFSTFQLQRVQEMLRSTCHYLRPVPYIGYPRSLSLLPTI